MDLCFVKAHDDGPWSSLCERAQFFHCVFPILADLYGPGDHLESKRAHVVADLMLRCVVEQPGGVNGLGYRSSAPRAALC